MAMEIKQAATEAANLPAGAFATISGGVVGALMIRGTMLDRITAGVAGAALAWYGGPVAAPILFEILEVMDRALFGDRITFDFGHIQSFAGFILGTTGMAVPSALRKLIDALSGRATKFIDK